MEGAMLLVGVGIGICVGWVLGIVESAKQIKADAREMQALRSWCYDVTSGYQNTIVSLEAELANAKNARS